MGDESQKNHKIRVAQYLRMSTDHQQFSIDNQALYLKKICRRSQYGDCRNL